MYFSLMERKGEKEKKRIEKEKKGDALTQGK